MLATTKILWRILGLAALLLGLIGLLLPVVPTAPFILVAAWAGSKGWPQLEQYLLSHKYFGPQIRSWRENGAVSRGAKWFTTVAVGVSLYILWLLPLHNVLRATGALIMVGVVLWLWSRPDAI